jgi:hypothetical protein
MDVQLWPLVYIQTATKHGEDKGGSQVESRRGVRVL